MVYNKKYNTINITTERTVQNGLLAYDWLSLS